LNEKVRESVQQHVRATRECALAFSILHPLLMSHREGSETLLDGWLCQPSHYRCRAELDEYALAAVFHRGEPRGFWRDLAAVYVGRVFIWNVGRRRLEAREADESKDLAQTMELDHGLDAVAPLGMAPSVVR